MRCGSPRDRPPSLTSVSLSEAPASSSAIMWSTTAGWWHSCLAVLSMPPSAEASRLLMRRHSSGDTREVPVSRSKDPTCPGGTRPAHARDSIS